jgi:hypothetical protein
MLGTLHSHSIRIFLLRNPFTKHIIPALAFVLFAIVLSGCAGATNQKLNEKSSTEPTNAKLSVIPSVVDFKSVVVGQKNSQPLKLTNISKDSISIQSLNVSGSGFTLSSGKSPLALAPGAQASLTIVFAPSATTEASGSLVISSPDLEAPVHVALSGSGEKAAPALTASPSALNFGSHAAKSSTSQSVTLTNTGNIAVALSSVAVGNSAFTISGLSNGVSLTPDQKVEFQVWFRPAVAGNSSSTVTIGASSLSSPVKLAVAGSATNSTTSPAAAVAHSVTLGWNSSNSSVAGYHVYRSETSSGPFQRLTDSAIGSLSYKDSAVEPGGHYYYVVTAVETNGSESIYSNEVSAEIPNT